MKMDTRKYGADVKWQDLTEGFIISGGGSSADFKTGEWAQVQPVFVEDKCKHCLLCVPVCPDSCIPVKDGKRLAFDLDHCKGCGICVKACPFGAIEMDGITDGASKGLARDTADGASKGSARDTADGASKTNIEGK